MPQLNQLADVAYSQFFWLLLVLALIYFGIGHAMLPKIQSTVDARDQRIAGDLAAAQAAREAADSIEAAYRARIDESRGEALKVAAAAKAESALATEARMKTVDAEVGARLEAAQARIRAATDTALGEIEDVAAEAAQQMVSRLAGLDVSKAEAAQAAKAALRQGSGQAMANG
jgi:F-type H+-transporting ATPase subunit b